MIIEKAETLPDSSFAYIEPGGVKDATGKTAPNVLRHLPYKSADGTVDLDSLAAALNAVKDTNLPRASQARVYTKLETVAIRHAKAAGVRYVENDGGVWAVKGAKAEPAPEWTDDAKASQKEAEKHGFAEDLKTDAGVRMSHKGGTALFILPAGKWHHSGQDGKLIGTGNGGLDLGAHLGKQPDHMGAVPQAQPTAAEPVVPGKPVGPAKPGVAGAPKDPAFEKEYADFKAQVKSEAGPGQRVQSLVFDRARYKKADDARAWANDRGYEGKAVRVTATSYGIDQLPPGDFEGLRSITLAEGVKAAVGFPKATVRAVRAAFADVAQRKLAIKRADLEKAECEAVGETDSGVVFKITAAGKSYHFAASGDVAVWMPNYEELSKNSWVHVVKAAEQRYTLTVVYPASKKGDAGGADFHGDIMTEVELEKSAWGFMEKGTDRIGLMHRPGTAGAGKVVESYIWRGPEWKVKDTGGTDQSVSPGDWVMGIVWSPEAWDAIKSGQITGVSLQGAARKEAF